MALRRRQHQLPDQLVAITGMNRSRHARTHMALGLPVAPITQMRAVVEAVAALADDVELDQAPIAARTAASEDATEAPKKCVEKIPSLLYYRCRRSLHYWDDANDKDCIIG